MHTCCISARPVKLTWFNRDELWSRVNLLTAYHSLPQLKSCIRGGKITHHLECHHSKNRLTSIMIFKKNNFPISLEYLIFYAYLVLTQSQQSWKLVKSTPPSSLNYLQQNKRIWDISLSTKFSVRKPGFPPNCHLMRYNAPPYNIPTFPNSIILRWFLFFLIRQFYADV